MKEISVVIPSYNSSKTILNCLNSIKKQKNILEIILVDSSNDDTRERVKKRFKSVKIIPLKNKTFPGSARNYGIKKAKGRIILLVDADCVLLENYTEELLKLHNDFDVVVGEIHNANPKNILSWVDYLVEFNEFIPSSGNVEKDVVPSCNMSAKKETFLKYGLFSNLQTAEDILFCLNAKKNGARIFFSNKLKVYHANKTKIKDILRKHYILGKNSAIVKKKYSVRGSVFVKILPFTIFLPILRSLLILFRCCTSRNYKLLLISLFLTPIIFLVLIYWSIGFFNGAIS